MYYIVTPLTTSRSYCILFNDKIMQQSSNVNLTRYSQDNKELLYCRRGLRQKL